MGIAKEKREQMLENAAYLNEKLKANGLKPIFWADNDLTFGELIDTFASLVKKLDKEDMTNANL